MSDDRNASRACDATHHHRNTFLPVPNPELARDLIATLQQHDPDVFVTDVDLVNVPTAFLCVREWYAQLDHFFLSLRMPDSDIES